jgi:cytochrome c5
VKSKKAVWGLIVLVVLTVSVASACGGATPEPAQPEEQPVSIDGETLLQDRCTECHALSRTASATKSAEEWEATVIRMVGHGANLNDEEQAALIDYLAQTYGP